VPPTRVSLSFALSVVALSQDASVQPSAGLPSPLTSSAVPRFLGVGSCAIRCIRIKGHSMLLTSTQVVPRSQHVDEPSVLLLHKIEELNKNTALLIAEAGKLIQESKQLSERIRSFEHFSTKPKPPPSRHY
jgi:hypothetical protein